jgi:hypothetical protein
MKVLGGTYSIHNDTNILEHNTNNSNNNNNNNNSEALVSEWTIPTERPQLVGEARANVCWCRVVSATDPYGRILYFLNRSRYYFFQVAP